MKKILCVLLVLLLCVIAVGFYRGWFTLTSPSDTENNKVNVNLTLDRDKVNADVDKVKEKTAELTDKVTERAKDDGDRANDTARKLNE